MYSKSVMESPRRMQNLASERTTWQALLEELRAPEVRSRSRSLLYFLRMRVIGI